MHRITSTKCDDFLIAIDSRSFIRSTVLAKMALHQPGFCMLRIHRENAIEKDLGDLPAFFRYCTSRVRTVDPDLRFVSTTIILQIAAENAKNFRHLENKDDKSEQSCQENVKKNEKLL